jgi:hypothetical protein
VSVKNLKTVSGGGCLQKKKTLGPSSREMVK